MILKKRKRDRAPYPGLDKGVNLKIRHEEMDQDYIHKLSPEEKDWLSRFNEEYIGANFNHKGAILHKTKALKKDCEYRNNHRNAETLAVLKVKGGLVREDINKTNRYDQKFNTSIFEKNRSTNPNEREDALNSIIDQHERIKRRAKM